MELNPRRGRGGGGLPDGLHIRRADAAVAAYERNVQKHRCRRHDAPFAQDLGSMKEIYGEGMGAFFANTRAVQVFSATDDPSTKLASDMIGNRSMTYIPVSAGGGAATQHGTYLEMITRTVRPTPETCSEPGW
ncbi:MAG TPA: TraM recognition domain-containing protein, partial [Humisphaera sp.]|nr:TraM recognition domain-containing protein [Humisphaera sp.]